jgi:Fe-S-cluster-containing hydrogenase component 2
MAVDPLASLAQGKWVKLICGASFQHLPAIRTLVLVYTLAGVDCIDVGPDPAVLRVVQEAIVVARSLKASACVPSTSTGDATKPWVMVSVNDGDDPHFRKAIFDPQVCPTDCPQPCVAICPTLAIAFPGPASPPSVDWVGVNRDRCYGCGRCLPICPIGQIQTQSHQFAIADVVAMIVAEAGKGLRIDALEIHTQVGHFQQFQQLWASIGPITPTLAVLSISCPSHPESLAYLRQLYDWIAPVPCALIWQADGRPMSGDIGVGATRSTVQYAESLVRANLPGYVQLAGGTNHHTLEKLRDKGLLAQGAGLARTVAGVAYGSYGRALLAPIQAELENRASGNGTGSIGNYRLEAYPDLLDQAVAIAQTLLPT